jgi:hypothetical protein
VSYNIGPGVKDAIAQFQDDPRSDEVYLVQTSGHKVSQTFARDAIYYYFEEDNRVRRVPFDL